MRVTYYNEESIVGSLQDLINKSKRQDDTRRTNYKLFGSIENHPLKGIVNEMEDITAPVLNQLKYEFGNTKSFPENEYEIIPNSRYYIESKEESLLVHVVTIISFNKKDTAQTEKVGFSAYSAELQAKDKNVFKKNALKLENFIDKFTINNGSQTDDKISPVLETMASIHNYILKGEGIDLSSFTTYTDDQKQALKSALIHEISASTNEVPKNFESRFGDIIKHFPNLISDNDFIGKSEKELFKKCNQPKVIALEPKRAINVQYTLSYAASNILSISLPVVAAIKVHLMQYFIINLPSFLSLIGVTLAGSYISFIAALASLAVCLLSYLGLNYIAYREFVILYGEKYKNFCKKISIVNLFKNIFYTFDSYLNAAATNLNQFIASTIAKFVGYISSYYKLDDSQMIEDIKNLKNLIFRYAAMSVIQNIMLLGAFLCLFLPAYQLTSAVVVLIVYVAFSCGYVTPNNVAIIRKTGSDDKAISACQLFGVTTSGVESYNFVKDFLGYKDLDMNKKAAKSKILAS